MFETARELPAGKPPSPPRWGSTPQGLRWPLRISPSERFYGLGEFFGPLDHARQELRVSVRDDLKRTWKRETRHDRQTQGKAGPTPQLTGKYAADGDREL